MSDSETSVDKMQGRSHANAIQLTQILLLGVLCILALVVAVHTSHIADLETDTAENPTEPVSLSAQTFDQSLFSTYCTRVEHFRNCFDLVSEVESLLRLESRDAIFDALAALEPQTGPVVYWGVDQDTEEADSHLSLDVQGVVDYFDNPAYFYSVDMHKASVDYGNGWSLGLWKTLPSGNNTVTESVQLNYCEVDAPNVRVCGAFNIFSETVTL